MKQDRPLSYSALKEFNKSPNNLIAYWNRDLEQTSSMIKGSIIHTLVLEPDTFDSKYAIFEGKVRRGKEFDIFVEENQGKIIINQTEMEEAHKVREAVWNNELCKDLFNITKEVEKEFLVNINGVDIKGIIDGIGSKFIFDLKTCQSSEPRKFNRDFYNYDYHLQGAIYARAMNVKDYYIIAAETSEPYNVTVFKVDNDFLEIGNNLLESLIEKYKKWDGTPCGYAAEIEIINVPDWMKKDVLDNSQIF